MKEEEFGLEWKGTRNYPHVSEWRLKVRRTEVIFFYHMYERVSINPFKYFLCTSQAMAISVLTFFENFGNKM